MQSRDRKICFPSSYVALVQFQQSFGLIALEMVSDGANVTCRRVKLVSHGVAMSVECERDCVSACFPPIKCEISWCSCVLSIASGV